MEWYKYLPNRVKYTAEPRLQTTLHYLVSSVRGQDESNPALWLTIPAGKMELSWPLGTARWKSRGRGSGVGKTRGLGGKHGLPFSSHEMFNLHTWLRNAFQSWMLRIIARKNGMVGEKNGIPCFPLRPHVVHLDPVFSTRPRVVHQTPYSPDPVFSTLRQPVPRPRVFHLAARDKLPCPARKQFPERHIINPLLIKVVRSRWLDIGLSEEETESI